MDHGKAIALPEVLFLSLQCLNFETCLVSEVWSIREREEASAGRKGEEGVRKQN